MAFEIYGSIIALALVLFYMHPAKKTYREKVDH
jgi:hypothetical protein